MNTKLSIGMIALFFAVTGTILMAEEKPEAIPAAAKKLSDNQPWRVESGKVAIPLEFDWIDAAGKEIWSFEQSKPSPSPVPSDPRLPPPPSGNGASIYRPGKNRAIVTICSSGDSNS
jgi:hypothetical protein